MLLAVLVVAVFVIRIAIAGVYRGVAAAVRTGVAMGVVMSVATGVAIGVVKGVGTGIAIDIAIEIAGLTIRLRAERQTFLIGN